MKKQEPQSRELQGSIQAFLNESVAPYLSGHLPASSFLQQEVNRMVGMRSIQAGSSPNSTDDLIELPQRSSSSSRGIIAAMGMQGAASNPSTSSYTQVMQEMEEEKPFGGYGVIARGEQDYMSWTLPGSNYASAALTKEYTGFVDPPSNSAGDQSLYTDVAVFKEYTQMATSHVPNPVTVDWSPHQCSSSSTLGTLLGQVHHLSPSGTLDVDPHIMPNQGLAAGLDSVSSQIQWNLDLELASVAGQFEAPVGNLILQPHGGHSLVGIPSQMLNPPADHAELLDLYNLGGKGTNAQPQSFQASGSTISSQLPSTSAPRNHHSFQFRHDSSRSPFRSFAQIDRMQSRLQQQLSSSTTSSSASQASRLQGQPPCTTVDVHAKPKGHLIQTWVRNWQDKRWQQQQDVEVELAGEDARSPQTIARDEHQAVKHMRAERARRKIFNCRLQTLKSLVPIIHKKKDKVTVLSSTIDYIRHLTSSLENKAARPLVLLSEQQLPADRPSTNITAQLPEELAGGASSSISTTGPVIVEIEPALAATGDETRSSTSTTLVIRVEAQNHSRSLVHLLNVLHDGFGLQLTNLDYRCVNDQFHATITIENPGDHNLSSIGRVQLREALQRELAASPNGTPTTGSDLS